jgi:rfaE bifunctional protein kinase chain/domain
MNVTDILNEFTTRSALVVGDICLDRWCTYDPAATEPSRETGIPRLGVVSTELTPGAGGTVASNLIALGVGKVAVCGVIGGDGHGVDLLRSLRLRGIESDLIVTSPGIQTFTYTKLINGITSVEDQGRVDFINAQAMPDEAEGQLLAKLRDGANAFDVIIVSDQAETGQGAVTPAIREHLCAFAKSHPEKVVWVDSRVRPELFRGVIVKPNQQEADAACLRAFGTVDYQRLQEWIGSPLLLVTHGAEGVLLIEPGRQTWVKTRPNPNPVDICGAGDSFSAGAAMALSVTHSPIEAARFGNIVASITVTKKGTGTASPAEVRVADANIPR